MADNRFLNPSTMPPTRGYTHVVETHSPSRTIYISGQLGMTPERVVALHAGATYRAYMYGFLPGFCYLGGLPKELTVSRRLTIRAPHPSGTIMIGAGMGLITTFAMPTGWW